MNGKMMKTALLVIDVQMALAADDAGGAERSCRGAEDNIARLLKAFRDDGKLVAHVHHHGMDEADPFHPAANGAAVQPFAAPAEGEPVVVKTSSSGFAGTGLEAILRDAGVGRVVLCGATANHCVESTTRSAADLGFQPIYAADAVWAYGAAAPDGTAHNAETIHSVTMATHHGEIADVRRTAEILAM